MLLSFFLVQSFSYQFRFKIVSSCHIERRVSVTLSICDMFINIVSTVRVRLIFRGDIRYVNF